MSDLIFRKFCEVCGEEPVSEEQIFVAVHDSHFCVRCINALHEYVQTKTVEQVFTADHSTLYPRQIKNYLDRFVVKQDKAKEILSVAIHNHLHRIKASKANIKIPKNNVLLIGPTGTGKTFMTETLAKYIKVPFVSVDITKYTEAGYVGHDVENILALLLKAAGGVVEDAEKGIIFIDEIDKIAEGRNGKGVSDIGVQRGLLKMLEGGEQQFQTDGKMSATKSMHTDNILFIFGGAFSGLHEQIKSKEVDNYGIGFTNIVGNKEEKISYGDIGIHPQHLIDYGMMPEFMGRASMIAELEPLNTKDLIDILTKAEDNIIEQYKTLFKMDGVDVNFTPKFFKAVAKEATERKLGARGLKAIVEKALIPHLMDIDTGPKKLDINGI